MANLSNNKDVFMCILRFHAQAAYLQHYEALLKELNDQVPDDAAPQDEPQDQWYILVYTDTSTYVLVCTSTYLYILIWTIMYQFVLVHTIIYLYLHIYSIARQYLVRTFTYLYIQI